MCAVLITGGMWTGYLLADGDQISPAQQKLATVFGLIEHEYVDEVSADSLVEMAIPALLKNLDPHTMYVPASELEKVNRDLESSFFGVGITFQIMSDSICVVEVVSGGPAQRAGILAGDRIIAVDGKDLTGKDVSEDEVFTALRGAKDTNVKLTVHRTSSKKPLEFDIVRGEIPSLSIDASYLMGKNVGYVKVAKFAPNTYNEFLQAISSLHAKGAESFVLDLRGNSGGLVQQAILIANEFLQPYRTIVETRGRIENRNELWMADGTGGFTQHPLVVLVDEFTASASEIVAGAIQDNDRGLILGRRSFGKGLVQQQIDLPDSSQIRLTVQRYFTPSGRCIQKDYAPGKTDDYEKEVVERYSKGEIFNADSIKLDETQIFTTVGGRTVHGGGGINPDVFVPSDTTGYSSYYFQVANSGLLNKFAYEYADLNRDELSKAKNVAQLLKLLPDRSILLWAFVKYAADNGVAQRWYYINISADLIVNQLKALIARDILGMGAYYEINNMSDPTISEAIRQIEKGVDTTIQGQIDNEKSEDHE